MAKPRLLEREKYRPVLRCSSRLILWIPMLVVAAGVMAVILDLAFVHGFYLTIIAPVGCAALIGLLLMFTVAKAEIRHPFIALMLGSVLGALLYIGHFHAGLVRDLRESDGWQKVDLLPSYMMWRMETTTVEDTHHDTRHESRPSPVANWLLGAIELVLCMIVPAGIGMARTRKPYGERARRWLDRAGQPMVVTAQDEVISALRQRDATALARALDRSEPLGYPQLMLVWDHAPEVADESMYLSLKVVTAPAQNGSRDPLSPPGQLLVDRILLMPAECQILRSLVVASTVRTGFPATDSATDPATALADAGHLAPSRAATVQRMWLPLASDAEYVRRGRGRWINGQLALVPAALVLVSLALMVIGLASILMHCWDWWWTIPLMMIGISILVATVIGLVRGRLAFVHRRIVRVLSAAICQRHNRLLDPVVDARLVEIIPRESWIGAKLDPARELGFLCVDPTEGLLFEGERERWICPAAAIAALALVDVSVPDSHGGSGELHTYVVLRVTDAQDQVSELPLRVRCPGGLLSRTPPRALTERLFHDIQALVKPTNQTVVEIPPATRTLNWGTWSRA